MPTDIKLWRISSDQPVSVPQEKLDLESRLEKWLTKDISLVGNDVLVIGRQITTDYGGIIDILGMDPEGNLLILELKRDKTPRDIVAQVLDYASWVADLSAERINEIAEYYLENHSLETSFKEHFQSELPEVLNERHRIYIVASKVDSSTERIVKYLSESHNMDINVITFAYFQTSEGEFLGRSTLLDEIQVETRAESKSKRRPKRTWEELENLAKTHGVVELYNRALEELNPLFETARRRRSNVALYGKGEDGKRSTILGIYPGVSSEEKGLVIGYFPERLHYYFNLQASSVEEIVAELPTSAEISWQNSYHFDNDTLTRFLDLLKRSDVGQP